jgi:protein-S-isoprenylcysteine O-methyltransferase Ste14
MLALQISGMFLVIALVLFLAAGTVAWPAAWVFLALFLGFTVALSGWLLEHDPGLLTERMPGAGRPDQKRWDKALYVVVHVLFLAWLVFMPLDAVRYRWSRMAGWLQATGAALLLCSFYFFFLTSRENAFLSPAARIQSDRGHTVVSTGPYAYVRHPMYAAAIIFMVGATLRLGSCYGLLPALVLAVAIAVRAVKEEGALLEELSGYRDYIAHVKYRLIPHVW